MLKLRIITAIILIAAVIGSIFYLPPWAFNSVIVLLTAMGAWEVALMFWSQQRLQQVLFLLSIIILTIAGILVMPYLPLPTLVILVYGALWWLIAPIILARYTKSLGLLNFNYFVKYIIGISVFVPFAVAFTVLQAKFGPYYLLYVLMLVWANDTGAYFAGRFLGKNPLAPAISPKKTLEGVYGGLILGLVVIICGGFLLGVHGIRLGLWIMLGIIISLWSVIGDLFESMLKRQADVKDSGALLPGHGGIYDRIDSLTAALPLFALGLLLL